MSCAAIEGNEAGHVAPPTLLALHLDLTYTSLSRRDIQHATTAAGGKSGSTRHSSARPERQPPRSAHTCPRSGVVRRVREVQSQQQDQLTKRAIEANNVKNITEAVASMYSQCVWPSPRRGGGRVREAGGRTHDRCVPAPPSDLLPHPVRCLNIRLFKALPHGCAQEPQRLELSVRTARR